MKLKRMLIITTWLILIGFFIAFIMAMNWNTSSPCWEFHKLACNSFRGNNTEIWDYIKRCCLK